MSKYFKLILVFSFMCVKSGLTQDVPRGYEKDIYVTTLMCELAYQAGTKIDLEYAKELHDMGWRWSDYMDNSGLKYSIFTRTEKESGKTMTYVAFAGTEQSVKDWATDFHQGATPYLTPGPIKTLLNLIPIYQYSRALTIFERELRQADKDPNLTLRVTGHSLGGAIAAFISRATGVLAYTVNATALAKARLDDLWPAIIRSKDKLAESTIIETLSNKDFVYKLPGKHSGYKIVLESNKSWYDVAGNHSIETIVNALKVSRPEYIPQTTFSEIANKNSSQKQLTSYFDRYTNNDIKSLFSYCLELENNYNSGKQLTSFEKYNKQNMLSSSLSNDANSLRQLYVYERALKQPLPVYSTTNNSGSMGDSRALDTKIITSLISNSNKTVIFGSNKTAEKTYEKLITSNGRNNVKWVKSEPDRFQRQLIAHIFGADAIVRARDWSYRETVTNGYRSVTEIDTRVKAPPRRRDEIIPPEKYTSYKPPDRPPSPVSIVGSHNRNIGGVGGVMLSGGADVSGNIVKNSGFSLIFENPDGEVDIRKLRMFVTALWAVYFGDEGPGISIDPIAPNIDKHLVRYIGQVKNSDLGRVMRDADYEMKQLAVGMKTSNVPGFMSPMQIASKNKVVHVGAMSRFWFVPEKMQFRQMANALVFEDGQVSLKTEYLFSGKEGESSPENEEFAEFFTKHYWEIAEDYPVLFELFEYSKLVSLAHYLKEKQVPLLWFLLSNREMLITEDSPGTVDELIKKTAFSQDTILVKGGVDLASQSSHSNYIIDKEAALAIANAMANYQPVVNNPQRHTEPTRTITFESANEEYTMVPMNDFTLSGSSASGEKYQTDFLFMKNSQPRLELARFYDPNLKTTHTFGEGWHLMIPYRVEPVGKTTIKFLNAVIPKTMQVHNLLTGETESLEFSTDRYSAAGYVPAEEEGSNTVGLFIMSNGSFRLVDRIGSEFHFDPAGRLENMFLTWISDSKPDYEVNYKYSRQVLTGSSSLYRIEPVDSKTVEVLNIRLPERMKLMNKGNGSEESFVFSKDNKYGIIGYLPMHAEASKYTFMALMSDGSFILEDTDDSQYSFNAAGRLESVSIEAVESMTQDDRTVNFEYELDKTGLRISRAIVRTLNSSQNLYHINYKYGDDGRLIATVDSKGNKKKILYNDELAVIALQ